MSWETIFKATTSKSAKIVWPSMKKLIDSFFEGTQEFTVSNLRNYLINNLDTQLQKDRPDISNRQRTINVATTIKDLRIEAGRSKYMDQKVPRYIKTNHERERKQMTGFYGDTYLPIKKSWDSTLKGKRPRSASKKDVEETLKEMLREYVKDKDRFSMDEVRRFIIDNLKQKHIERKTVNGQITSAAAGAPTRYIKNTLDSHLKSKIPIMLRQLGFSKIGRTSGSNSGIYTPIEKSDSWESIVDSMVDEKTFEPIYTAILRKFKFSSPSKEKVIAYLNANYERHPLFSNKWSTKNEGADK